MTEQKEKPPRDTSNDIAINLNGRWALLLKTSVLLIPVFTVMLGFMVPLIAWIVVGVFESKAFISRGDRFTREDGLELYMRMSSEHDVDMRKLETTITALPPTLWQDKISTLEENQGEVLLRLDRIENKLP